MSEHRVHSSTTAAGYAASCACGWRVVRPTRDERDQRAEQHRQATQ